MCLRVLPADLGEEFGQIDGGLFEKQNAVQRLTKQIRQAEAGEGFSVSVEPHDAALGVDVQNREIVLQHGGDLASVLGHRAPVCLESGSCRR